jgi:hypothetical protein
VLFTREALLDELAKEPNQSGSTERHASTKNFGLWKSFLKNFRDADSNPEEKFLSSSRVVNATRVVQEKRFGGSSTFSFFRGASFFLRRAEIVIMDFYFRCRPAN